MERPSMRPLLPIVLLLATVWLGASAFLAAQLF
jgi:hypothetical protein